MKRTSIDRKLTIASLIVFMIFIVIAFSVIVPAARAGDKEVLEARLTEIIAELRFLEGLRAQINTQIDLKSDNLKLLANNLSNNLKAISDAEKEAEKDAQKTKKH